MVRIDGARVKELRERQGLTQLYMATAVGVTTETISRWENRRYPSIMRENAEKLAETLAVEPAEILEAETAGEIEPVPAESVPPIPPDKPTPPSRLKRHLAAILLILLVLVVLQAVRYYSATTLSAPKVGGIRILPPHIPPGQPFPVLIRVEASEPVSFSLLLKENLPPGCEPVAAMPRFTSAAGPGGQVKWVSRLEGDKKFFAYLVKAPLVPENSELLFFGRILAGPMTGSSPDIGGDKRLRIDAFHWADRNRDQRIDDEEILIVYDLFSEVADFDFNRDLIDEIWAAGGYVWNGGADRYELKR
ncbi:MAG: helix-turn-helix transcriptional regulator [Desulfurivibrionaceae bacterium]|nr:helix-turn-helix transcriptional regulator [Desulfobulbales bacterium]MDT8335770.1 helix-turn-helix transcriptional regulator [Desulfurivibrionaceae bacterium]